METNLGCLINGHEERTGIGGGPGISFCKHCQQRITCMCSNGGDRCEWVLLDDIMAQRRTCVVPSTPVSDVKIVLNNGATAAPGKPWEPGAVSQ